MSNSTKTATKQELFKALILADSLEKIPGGRLISIMKMKTEYLENITNFELDEDIRIENLIK